MIIGNVAHVSPQLAQRRVLIDAYEAYKAKYIRTTNAPYPKCGLFSSEIDTYSNHYAFFFPDSLSNEIYVDDSGALGYFILEKNGILSRKWSSTASYSVSNQKLPINNNFLTYISELNSLKNQCGKLPVDKRPMDIFYAGYAYIYTRIDKNGKALCGKNLSDRTPYNTELEIVIPYRMTCKPNK